MDTKLSDTFLTSQFLASEFLVPCRRYQNKNGGGIIVFVLAEIPSRLLAKHVFRNDIKCLYTG